VNIAVNKHNFQWAFPEMVADELGLFGRHGLKVNWNDATPAGLTDKAAMYTELLMSKKTDIYHAGEWSDAACFTVGTDPVYVKYAGTTLYLAWPMKPTCGCGAHLAFNKTAAVTLDGNQIDLSIVDDPFTTTGDATELVPQHGTWMQASAIDPGIVIANPAMQPDYEIAISFAELGITAGQAHVVGVGISHSLGGVWPSGLTTPAGMPEPSNPADWGKLTSSSRWQ
jgi:hypothetical protein